MSAQKQPDNRRLIFTEAMDQRLKDARNQGLPWDELPLIVGASRTLCIERAKELGLPTGRIAKKEDGEYAKAKAGRRSVRRL